MSPSIREGVPESLLNNLSDYISTQMGLSFPQERWKDLERGIVFAAGEFGFSSAESFVHRLLSSQLSKQRIEILASYLTVGETYFFRDKKLFEILETRLFRNLIQARQNTEKRLRIWSAGCATGEEPYSLAILLNKIIPDLREWNITILATDINPFFLKKASEGIYSEWSFRDTSSGIKEKYFKKNSKSRYEIIPDIKKMVTFYNLNLAIDGYPSLVNNTNAMDIIFCRNVLMYFTSECSKLVIQKFYQSLVHGGWLVVSPCELSQVLFSQFVSENGQGLTVYRKGDGEVPAVHDYLTEVVSSSLDIEEIKIQQEIPFYFDREPPVQKVPSEEIAEPIPRDSEKDSNSDEWKYFYNEAFALYEKGDYEKVIEKVLKLFSEKEDNANIDSLLARAYANLGNLVKALEWCEKALNADKINPYYHYFRAVILQEQGNNQDAIKSLKRALYLDPNFVLAHFTLGKLVRQQGRFKESYKYMENALMLLRGFRQDEILPESDGMTAGRLSEIIMVMIAKGKIG